MRRSRPLPLPLAVLLLALASALAALAAEPWQMRSEPSKLSFVGTQAGAPFEGVFRTFTADIRFDPAELPGSRFEVVIDTGSVDSRDRERDDIIRGPDIFDAARWPSAHYVAEHFVRNDDGSFTGNGRLTLRDVTREVPIRFAFESDGASAWLKGGAELERLDFGVGQGEWRDTTWVGNHVRVQFALRLER